MNKYILPIIALALASCGGQKKSPATEPASPAPNPITYTSALWTSEDYSSDIVVTSDTTFSLTSPDGSNWLCLMNQGPDAFWAYSSDSYDEANRIGTYFNEGSRGGYTFFKSYSRSETILFQ